MQVEALLLILKEENMERSRTTSHEVYGQVGGLFNLILIASLRTRELKRGHLPMVTSKNGPIMTALQEIEEGKVGREYLLKLRK
jgi:DNA-directed RNA polymerase subunit omega